jgi:hypothetical protein
MGIAYEYSRLSVLLIYSCRQVYEDSYIFVWGDYQPFSETLTAIAHSQYHNFGKTLQHKPFM